MRDPAVENARRIRGNGPTATELSMADARNTPSPNCHIGDASLAQQAHWLDPMGLPSTHVGAQVSKSFAF